jgi:diacylglycerol kinase
MRENKKLFPSFIRAVDFAWQGISYAIRSQRNMKIHLAFTTLVAIALLILQPPMWKVSTIIILIAAVISAELFNTAIEALVDLVKPEQHPLAKIAKDTAAGAVLVFAGAAAFVGLITLLPEIFHLLTR